MGLYYNFFSQKELKQMDAIKESYGGASEIMKTIEKMQSYEERKKVAAEKGFGEMLEKAENYAKSFPKVEDYIEKDNRRPRRTSDNG